MIERRQFVLGAAAGVLIPRSGYAKASQPATSVNFDVPAGACDCHTHIHGNPEKFPWFAGRTYTPEMALPEEMTALHKALKIQRVVIVTPSVYGPDNSATIYGMAARGKDARGVAVIDDKTTDAERHCEAYFYAGTKRLIDGDKKTAQDYFEKCVATGLKNFSEYDCAAAELKALKAAK